MVECLFTPLSELFSGAGFLCGGSSVVRATGRMLLCVVGSNPAHRTTYIRKRHFLYMFF